MRYQDILDETTPVIYDLPFPREEYDERLRRTRLAMEEEDLDAIVVTHPKDFFWLASSKVRFDYTDNPAMIVVPAAGEMVGVVRHLERSTHERSSLIRHWFEYVDGGPVTPYDPLPALEEALSYLGLGGARIGLHLRFWSAADADRFRLRMPEIKVVDFSLDKERTLKSERELVCMEKAAEANQYALMRTVAEIDLGWSELQVLRRINELHELFLGVLYGGSSRSAQTCQIGRHAMDMHPDRSEMEMRESRLSKDDLALLEPGTFVNRLCGSKMRSLFFGNPPDLIRRASDANRRALETAMEVMKPGVTSGEVDAAMRSKIESEGLDAQSRMGYASGYGWDEGSAASIAPGDPLVLEPGHTFHVIPHSYVEGWGFVGMSEQITITKRGCRVLANQDEACPRDLLVVSK